MIFSYLSAVMRGLAIILGLYWVGDEVVRLLGLPIPGSLIGMLTLAFALQRGWLKPNWVEGTATTIAGIMPLFFVPAAAAFLEHASEFQTDWFAVVVASLVSTAVVFASVAWIAQKLEPSNE